VKENVEITDKIIRLKEERCWSYYQLAQRANVPQSVISNFISRGNAPSIHTLEKICSAFEITLAQFFDTDDMAQTLTDEQRALVNDWNSLRQDQKEKVKAYIQGTLGR